MKSMMIYGGIYEVQDLMANKELGNTAVCMKDMHGKD